MNDTQRNRLRMFKATRDYQTLNASILGGVPANGTVLTELSGQITGIDEMVAKQEAELAGHTDQKATRRAALEAAILLVANGAAAFARNTGDELMLAVVDITPTDLERTSEQTIDDTAANVITATAGSMAALADWGVTPADIVTLNDAVLDYEGVKTTPDVMRAMRTGMTEALEPNFKVTGKLLSGQMDKLMERYETTEPAFYGGYQAARVIIDLRGPGEEDPAPDPEP